jgi:hypothetical protein
MVMRDVIPPWAETMAGYAGGCHPARGSKRFSIARIFRISFKIFSGRWIFMDNILTYKALTSILTPMTL